MRVRVSQAQLGGGGGAFRDIVKPFGVLTEFGADWQNVNHSKHNS